MLIFGNDGFRSKYGEKYMTLEFITAFSTSITKLYDTKLQKLPILIGRDTRNTGNIIQNIIISILNYYGIETVCVGVVPTPVLSSILSEGKYSLGIMITASHDPSENNGIKLFNDYGYKLGVKSESILELFRGPPLLIHCSESIFFRLAPTNLLFDTNLVELLSIIF